MADFTTQQPEYPTMVKWSHEGCYLAIGFSDGRVMVYLMKLHFYFSKSKYLHC